LANEKNGVMPGQKREARLRTRCAGHPRLLRRSIRRRGWPGRLAWRRASRFWPGM